MKVKRANKFQVYLWSINIGFYRCSKLREHANYSILRFAYSFRIGLHEKGKFRIDRKKTVNKSLLHFEYCVCRVHTF